MTAGPSRIPRRPTPQVTVRNVSPAALEVALQLAGGDRSRLVFNADGSVTVTNRRRTVEPSREGG